ncbi:MAG: hypothetical protein K6B51_02370 [Bacilli bacterium]|nr:hypothetical protein [Bacilli bacterium]
MKKKKASLLLLPFLLAGCYIKSIPSDDKETIVTLNAELVFQHIFDAESNPLAITLLESSYFDFPEGFRIIEKYIAGDQINLTMVGDYDYKCKTVYPGDCHIDGNIKGYTITKTRVKEINPGIVTDISMTEYLAERYALKNEYIVLDQSGNYMRLDEYEGGTIYLTEDLGRKERECTCPEGMICEPCPDFKYVAGVYAFNPRPGDSLPVD